MTTTNPLPALLAAHKDADVARSLGVTKQAVNLWRRGAYPTVANLLKLAAYLGVEPGALLPAEAQVFGHMDPFASHQPVTAADCVGAVVGRVPEER
jgi:transcriptional regulator with XRE-family HTH domain